MTMHGKNVSKYLNMSTVIIKIVQYSVILPPKKCTLRFQLFKNWKINQRTI